MLDTDGSLDEIGHVGDMGVGEQVHSVRFLDDLAYVVTFRQVDPLYAIDLSDARTPRVLGELKIPGFSEYLHPLGDGLLLGVGREVDPATGIDEGLKISLFDVADPLQMNERDQIVVADGWSAVSNDHQAFSWDPIRRRAIVPVERSCGAGRPRLGDVPDGQPPATSELSTCVVRGVDGGRRAGPGVDHRRRDRPRRPRLGHGDNLAGAGARRGRRPVDALDGRSRAQRCRHARRGGSAPALTGSETGHLGGATQLASDSAPERLSR